MATITYEILIPNKLAAAHWISADKSHGTVYAYCTFTDPAVRNWFNSHLNRNPQFASIEICSNSVHTNSIGSSKLPAPIRSGVGYNNIAHAASVFQERALEQEQEREGIYRKG